VDCGRCDTSGRRARWFCRKRFYFATSSLMSLGWGSSDLVSFWSSRCCDSFSYLSLAASHGDVDETSSVCYSLLRASLGGLLLLLRLDLSSVLVSPGPFFKMMDMQSFCSQAVANAYERVVPWESET
jgi:hypothetical protein